MMVEAKRKIDRVSVMLTNIVILTMKPLRNEKNMNGEFHL